MKSAPIAPRLQDRLIFVSGGGSGIGRAAAIRVAAEGATVIVADVREGAALAVAARIEESGGRAVGVNCDVSREAEVEAAFHVADSIGAVDAIVLAAGLVDGTPTHETSWADWSKILTINLGGIFLCSKHALHRMLPAGRGAIVTVGSVASLVAAGRSSVYAASKGGVLQFTRFIAAEYGPSGIRANCLCPGEVRTSLKANSEELLQAPLGSNAIIPPRTPLGRGAEAEEMAPAIAFLCSDESSFMTGACVVADGGYTAI